VFGAAAAGLVLGHALAYLIAIPDPHERAFALQRAGHAYLPALDQVALMLAIAGVVAIVVRAFARRRDGATERFGRLATLLVVVQTSAFAGQEVLERLVSGSPLGDLLHSRILVNGPATQGCIGVGNGLTPSLTLGCGTFGGNSTTDNVTYTNLLNIKRLARPFI